MKGPVYPVTIQVGPRSVQKQGKNWGDNMEPSYDLLVPSEITATYSQQCPGIRPHLFRDRGRQMSHAVIDGAGRVAETSTGPPAYYTLSEGKVMATLPAGL